MAANQTRWDNIVEKSTENMESAKMLIEKEKYNAAVSRMYYAVFQLIYKEMLDQKHVSPEKVDGLHSEACIFLQKSAVKDVYAVFKNLRGSRVKADYLGCCNEEECKQIQTDIQPIYKQLRLNAMSGGRSVLHGYTKS